MPRKTGRRGFGWSRIRSGMGQKRKRVGGVPGDGDADGDGDAVLGVGVGVDSDAGEAEVEDDGGWMLIGPENEERWARLKTALGFGGDDDFAAYLLTLAEQNKSSAEVMQSSQALEERQALVLAKDLPPNPTESTNASIDQEQIALDQEANEDGGIMASSSAEAKDNVIDENPNEESQPLLMMACDDDDNNN